MDPRREKGVVNDELVERLARAEEELRIREIRETMDPGRGAGSQSTDARLFRQDIRRVERLESFRCGPP